MAQKTILITGASDGIGAASARSLAMKGERVLIVGRNAEKTAAVAGATGAEPFVADFSRLDEVRALADQVKDRLDGSLDVLANNAGGIFGDRLVTTDGFEYTFQVNHLAPFLLTQLLLDELLAATGSVVNTSSVASRLFGDLDIDDLGNERNYSPAKAYGDAKLENILFTRALHARFHDRGLSTMAFHPGNVATNFAADTTNPMRFIYHTPLRRLALISADKGGANLTWAIEGRPGTDWQSGEYYDQRKPARRFNPQMLETDLADRLWDRSAEMVSVPTR
ncbi:MAG: SDR family NAD(P)-dependent oxidoreductase [Propionibacteriaceae bacterium]|nr:SDR family NAD(P)-dependent oxidoreductase [Propionibacteriaceae bacterium]